MSRNDLLLHIRNQGRRKAENPGGGRVVMCWASPASLLGIGLKDLQKSRRDRPPPYSDSSDTYTNCESSFIAINVGLQQ